MDAGILAQLRDHQFAIREAMTEARALLACPAAAPQAVAAARWALARALTAYQGFVHQHCLDPITREGTPDDARIARQTKIECIALAESFRAYARRWAATGIEGRETAHRHETRGMMQMIERQIVRERDAIEALLARDKQPA